ncbi:pimeloyl-ACP methyl ester carboxylesterase [Kushneria sinocarnis]|uniref:Pimeloyl-ACP methyl ester carboxylesterase n=1 Tax=Kushneria sinocarnis TaxID=595502 RepID=A0A420WZU1_9GAMM|nr:alpha/beta hydrolase [Kushneria sinocarnis]RKR06812.1 pimeloyl-ACP methyl ester carboxylesterase [Kushneria sinocarnis]
MHDLSRQLRRMLGGAIRLKVPDLQLEQIERDWRYPESHHLALANGIRLHYRDSHPRDRRRPVLILLHGMLVDSEVWSPLWSRLAEHYRLVAIDLPGHGLTMAPASFPATIEAQVSTLHAALGQLGIERCSLAGSSMGGLLAWSLALAAPERIERLILIGAAGWADERSETRRIERRMQLLGAAPLRPLLRYFDPAGIVTASLQESLAPHEPSAALIERHHQLARLPGHRDILLNLARHWRSRPLADPRKLQHLSLPVLIIAGDNDALIPLEHAHRFHRAMPNARLVVLAGSGHLPMLTMPDRVAAEIDDCLQRDR